MRVEKLGKTGVATLLVAAGVLGGCGSAGSPPPAAPAEHITIQADGVRWGAPPEGVITGTPSIDAGGALKFALMEGDPTKPGAPFTIRLACTDGYRAAPHWHPTDENVVVVSGTFALATGDVFTGTSLDAAHELKPGAYGFMPAKMHHFGQCRGDTDLIIYGVGPFEIHFLPAPAGGKS